MMTREKLWRGRPNRNTSSVESISHPPMTHDFIAGISKDWKKGRALVGRRWPWPWRLGKARRGVHLPPRAALGCCSDIPIWVLPALPALALAGSHPAEIPLCVQTCSMSGNSSGTQTSPLAAHAPQLSAPACGHRGIRRDKRHSRRGVVENHAELGSELASTRTLQPRE